MKSVILSLLLFSSYVLSKEQLLFVLEVARHGARSPTAVLPLNSTSVNFNDTMMLVQEGWNQHQKKGQTLRDKYVTQHHFLSPNYNESEVFVQATTNSRTQLSAQAQLSGLFPDQAWYHPWLIGNPGSKTQGYTIYNASDAFNLLTKMSQYNCPYYGAVLSDVLSSSDYAQVRGYWYDNYKDRIQNVTGYPIPDQTTYDQVCEYLYFSQFTDIKLNFTPSTQDRTYCMAYEDGWIYQTDYGQIQEWQLVSYEFMNQLSEISSYILGDKKTVQDLPTFNKYFSRVSKQTQLPKFVLYTSHDEIIGAYLEAFDLHNIAVQSTPPAGHLLFEFFLDLSDNEIKVRTTMNKTTIPGKPDQELKLNLNGTKYNVLPLKHFKSFVDYRNSLSGFTDIAAQCKSNYVSNGRYYDANRSIAELKKVYAGNLFYKQDQTFLQQKLRDLAYLSYFPY